MKEYKFSDEYYLPYKSEIMRFTISGNPVTKKTHNILIKNRSIVLPSKQYTKYAKDNKSQFETVKGTEPIDCGINIDMTVYTDSWRIGDHCGYMQAIGDLLQKFGIIADDKLINWSSEHHWFGGVDKDNPRVEIIITRFKHPYEASDGYIKKYGKII